MSSKVKSGPTAGPETDPQTGPKTATQSGPEIPLENSAEIEGSCRRSHAILGAQLVDCTTKRWNDAAEERFLDELATSANATRATKASGFSENAVYSRRRKYPEFAEKWQTARQQGVARIEMELVRSAQDSLTLDDVEYGKDRPIPRMSVAEAMAVVRMFGENGERTRNGRRAAHWLPRDPEQARLNIIAKVRMVRDAANYQASYEDKDSGGESA